MAINGTLELIEAVTVPSGGQAAIEFTSIPQTYDDLVIKLSARSSTTYGNAWYEGKLRLNSSDGSSRELYGTGSAAGSGTEAAQIRILGITSSGATANTFGSADIYISNYRSSNNKSVSIDSVSENNATASISALAAGLWSNSAAVTSLQLVLLSSANFAEHSTAHLYGVTRVPAGAKATGGVITETDTHWVHTFTSSGVFTPLQNITCDYLVVAGGGGAGYRTANDAYYCGGGGGGGLLTSVGTSGGGGGAGSALSLTQQTYPVVIGAGGAAPASNGNGANGNNSSISSITAIGGGGGAVYAANGLAGGSGGGAASDSFTQYYGGAGTSGQGYAGGNMETGNALAPGAGGGAGGVGGNGGAVSSGKGGTGGAALANSITGTSTYYSGGGAGGRGFYGSSAVGDDGTGWEQVPNRGMGGGRPTSAALATGGSGVVIIRYAK